MHCLTPLGQWVVQLLQYIASLPGGSGRCNSCNAVPHCLGALGSGTSVVRCHAAQGQWPEGSTTPAVYCLTPCGQWAVQPLQYTASPLVT